METEVLQDPETTTEPDPYLTVELPVSVEELAAQYPPRVVAPSTFVPPWVADQRHLGFVSVLGSVT
jgi:hypothetical protein